MTANGGKLGEKVSNETNRKNKRKNSHSVQSKAAAKTRSRMLLSIDEKKNQFLLCSVCIYGAD